jgi:hypothetical protein
MIAASAAGIPVAVKGGGVATAGEVGATVVVVDGSPTFVGDEVHPLSTRALVRRTDTPRKRAGRDEGRKT